MNRLKHHDLRCLRLRKMRLRDDFIPLFGQYKTFYDGFIHNNDNIDRDIAFRHAFINVTIRLFCKPDENNLNNTKKDVYAQEKIKMNIIILMTQIVPKV